VRVALAEDSLVYRNGLVRLLEASGATVVYEAASGTELLSYLADADPVDAAFPDVVMLDIRMAGRADDGLLAAEQIAAGFPTVGILMLSAHADAGYAQRLFANGSAGRGYLLKESLDSVSELQEALSRVQRGRTYTDPKVVDELIYRDPAKRIDRMLSPRELDVLTLLASGASNAAIARHTRSTAKSVESAISGLYSKLGIADAPDYNRRVLVVLTWLGQAAPSPAGRGPLSTPTMPA
jgi:DNA-binding NarL/FixJ family response regulator